MKNKEYTVKKIDFNVKDIVQSIPDSIWDKAISLEDFSCPWNNLNLNETSFKALYSDEYLYLRYIIKDTNILIYNKNNNKMDVAQSDRVEIFFKKNNKLEPYYCLEIDPNGKVLDYKASYYRKFDSNWHWPKGHLFTKGLRTSGGYRVEVTISISSLHELGVLKDNVIEAGIYRGDCIKLPNKKGKDAEIKWITWVDPKTEEPDFHVPTSFVVLNLFENKNNE